MDIAAWLRELGLERYEAAFRDNDVDGKVLPHLTADDLKDIGITSVGHRRSLLAAIDALRPETEAPEPKPSAAPPATERSHDAERRQLTVMFVDLVGSTALSGRLDPEDMREVIAAYHNQSSEVIRRYEGHVAKYMGDGVLAYFGYPRAHEDDAERAVRAGLELAEAIGRQTADGARLTVRIGIATGQVVVGDLIGEGASQEEAVVGETPSLAARLQELAQPGAVVVACETRRLLHGVFELRDLGEHQLKGFETPVRIWHVAGESAVESRFEALRAQRLTPLIGRDDEVEILTRRWRRARQGEGQVVLIAGEAGIGKSRLAATLREEIAHEPHIRLTYQCSPHHTESAFYPVIRQLKHAAGIRAEQSPKKRLDRLEALLRPSSNALEVQVPLLASLLSIPVDGRYPVSNLSAQELKERTLRTLVQQLEGLATARSLLIVFEDLHWADPSTLELLDRLVECVESLPVLVLLTARPGFAAAWMDHAHVTLVTLNRIGKRDSRALFEALAGEAAVPEELIEEVTARSDGVPLFVEEMARAVLEIPQATGGPAAGGAHVEVPVSLQDSLMARLDRLATGKPVAQKAAAVGRDFTADMLEPICGLPRPELERGLSELVGAGLLNQRGAPSEPFYVFKHALVQDAAYNSLLRSARRQLHRRIAQSLDEHFTDQPAMLAHHWECAEELDLALTYRLQAGQRAAARNAIWEAVAQYWRALELLQRLPECDDTRRHHLATLLELIRLDIFWQGEADRARALRHIDRAIEIARDSGNTAALARLKAFKGIRVPDEALLMEAVRHAANAGDLRVRAMVASYYGSYHGWVGRHEESIRHVEQAIQIYAKLGEKIQQGMVMAGNARCFSARAGSLRRSFQFAQHARAIADATGDLQLRSWLGMEAEPCLYKGLWQRTVEVVEQELPAAWEIGNWSVILWCSGWATIAEIKLGQHQAARSRIEAALKKVGPRAADFFRQAYPTIALGHVRLAEGDLEAAMGAAGRVCDGAERVGLRLEQGAAHRLLAQTHEARGDRQEAESEYSRSLDILGAIQSRPELAQSLLAYGRFKRADDPDQGRQLLTRALEMFEQMEATGWIAETLAASEG